MLAYGGQQERGRAGANEYGNAAGQPVVEWHIGGPDPIAITWPGEERQHPYRETVQKRNEPTSTTGDASPKRKVRSGD
jgi:hypothetical protein